MSRRVLITGVGPISGLGIGIDANWTAARDGECAIKPIAAFDAGGFDCRVAAEVPDFKIGKFVPKHYRKATKVMARDIELAVAAADQAARDAGLNTPGVAAEGEARTYDAGRIGCHAITIKTKRVQISYSEVCDPTCTCEPTGIGLLQARGPGGPCRAL